MFQQRQAGVTNLDLQLCFIIEKLNKVSLTNGMQGPRQTCQLSRPNIPISVLSSSERGPRHQITSNELCSGGSEGQCIPPSLPSI